MTGIPPKGRVITMWVLTILLGVLYLSAGGTKLAGQQMHVEHFAQWGYPDWFRLFVGAWEVAFGVLLIIPRTSVYGAMFLSIGMIGAIYTELFRGDPPRALFPAVLFALLVWLAYTRRSSGAVVRSGRS